MQKQKVLQYGIETNVQFLGFRNDCFDLMYNAKATIVPSRCEGFGFITVEAINAGGMA
jgi:glycosyltransferase involved in cell wall biosynthesis